MTRRAPYTKLEKTGQVRPAHVQGMGDVAFKGFQCPTPECAAWIFLRSDELAADFEFTCESCGKDYANGDVVRLYDFELVERAGGRVIESGAFELLLDDYVEEATEYKYCIMCYCMKPLEAFDRHSARRTGRQGECNLCKQTYNSIKNQSRTADQHREAAQKRRLYVDLGGSARFNTSVVRNRFDDRCFNCGVDLSQGGYHIDHTLPIKLLWPVTTETATLLCSTCNGQKSGTWPGQFYSVAKLRRLAALTGINYRLMLGQPQINPAALERLTDGSVVEAIMAKYAAYPDELIRLRNRVLELSGVDLFASSSRISAAWTRKADLAWPT